MMCQRHILPFFAGKCIKKGHYASLLFAQKRSFASKDGEAPPTRAKSDKLTSLIVGVLRKSSFIDDEDLIHIIAKTTSVASYSIMSIALLGTFGVDTKPFIAGIGVTGFAAGFALKEIATNYISGVLLVFSKPFNKGQYIKVMTGGGLEGEVQSVEIRHVILKTKDNGLLMIPSALVYSNPIVILPKI